MHAESMRCGPWRLAAARITLVVTIAASATACWRSYPKPDPSRSDSNRNIGFAPWRVTGKEPPSTLFSRGGRCTVTAKRFAEVREGDMIWCAWRTGDR